VRRAALILACGLAACGSPPAPGRVTASDAILYLQSNVRDAAVYLDGQFVAPASALGRGMAVEPGRHRLELRHEDYYSSYLELELARAEHKRLAIDLAEILP